MKRILAFALLVLCVPAAAAARQATPPAQAGTAARLPSVELPAELERVLRDYERGWRSGDAAGLARIFTEDGFANGQTAWRRGREEIEDQYAGASGDLRLRAHAWHTSGEAGWIVGSYGYGEVAADVDMGKFLLALRRAGDGRWLIAADLDSSNRNNE